MPWTRLLGAVLLCAAAGCGPPPGPDQPPDIRLGEDACAQCSMIINEARFAAGFREDELTTHRFDDIGCLVRYLRAGGAQPERIWLHDFQEDEWVPAAQAYIVFADSMPTAMGSGLVALASASDARALADDQDGKVLRWDEVVGGAKPSRDTGK